MSERIWVFITYISSDVTTISYMRCFYPGANVNPVAPLNLPHTPAWSLTSTMLGRRSSTLLAPSRRNARRISDSRTGHEHTHKSLLHD